MEPLTVKRTFHAEFPAGTTYALSGRTLHRVVVKDNEYCATWMLQGRPTYESVTVLSNRYSDTAQTYRVERPSAKQLRLTLGHVLETVG
jgi:hypothetical protein